MIWEKNMSIPFAVDDVKLEDERYFVVPLDEALDDGSDGVRCETHTSGM
jgi:hypothetical protein